jgi:hypothetical protein
MQKVMTSIQPGSLLMMAIMLLISCSDHPVKKNSNKQQPDTALAAADTLINRQQKKEHHPFRYEGKKEDSVSWIDKEGSHYFIVSISNKGEYLTENWSSEIHGNLYSKSDTGMRKDFEIHDSAVNQQEMIYLSKSLQRKDVDGDGKYEVWFLYYFGEDGADPVTEKMILHTDGGQLTMRGLIPRSVSDLDSYEQHIDKEERVNTKIEAFALRVGTQCNKGNQIL